jgi:hypothetical protein
MGDNVNVNDANVNEDANEEDDENIYANAVWTEVQLLDNADEDVTLLKVKNAGGNFNIAKALRAINASFDRVPGFIQVVMMGERANADFKVMFASRGEAEAHFNTISSPDCTYKYADYKFRVMSYTKKVGKVSFEVRDLEINADGAPTALGWVNTSVNVVAAVNELLLTNYTLESLLNVKVVLRGTTNYAQSAARGGHAADVFFVPKIKGMEMDECSDRLPELIKMPGTVKQDKHGTVRQTFMCVKNYTLVCADCEKKGHKPGSKFCYENANSFVSIKRNFIAGKMEENRAKRRRDEA